MRNTGLHRILVGVLSLILGVTVVRPLGSVSHAQTTSGPARVTLQFRAVSRDGQPARDVALSDLALLVNGRPREIRSLDLVDLGSGPGMEDTSPLAPPFASNDILAAGRNTVLVIDEESFQPGTEEPVRGAVAQLLSGLSARDRVGAIFVPHGTLNVGATTIHGTVRQAVAKMVGRAPRTESDAEALCRSRVDLESLKNIFGDLAGEPLTTVIFFSTGLMPPSSSMHRPGTQLGLCEVRSQDLQDVARARHASPVDFYVYQIPDDGTRGASSVNNQLAGLESLAAVTDGTLLRQVGDNDPTMARVLRETSVRHQLTFQAEASERNGSAHRVELSIGRDRMTAHVQASVLIPKPEGQPGGKKGPTVAAMLRGANLHRNLPLAVAGFSSRNPGDGKVKLAVLFEPLDRTVKLASAAVGLFDQKGNLKIQGTIGAGDLARYPIMTSLVVPAGSYKLRVAAIDATGRGGSVEEELRLELAQGGVTKLSSMVLGASVGNRFSPKLEFSDEAAAIGYLEIYGAPKGAALSVSFDLTTSADGPALATVPATTRPAESDDTSIVFVSIPIEALPPADYVVRATVSLDGQPAGRVVRILHKTAR